MTQQVVINDISELGSVLEGIDRQFRSADYSRDLAKFVPVLRSVHAEHFHEARDSEKRNWQPLAESTAARKGHRTILVDTTRLRRSLTVPGGDQIATVSHRGMIFGTSVPYAHFHQTGTSRMPARPPVGMTKESVDQLAEHVADATVELLK